MGKVRNHMLKIKEILFYIVIFVISLISSFGLVFSIINNLYKFELISINTVFITSITISVVISILVIVLTIMWIYYNKTKKFFYWIGETYPKLVLGYIILTLFSASITKEVRWSAIEISEVVSTIWTIFGLSITIFLVWNVIIVGYLKNTQPNEKEEKDLCELYKYLTKKQSFSQDIKLIFNTVTLLVINLFVLLMATVSIYLLKKPESLFTQNITMCAFYFSTNTLVSLFLDILKPLRKDKKELLDKNKVEQKELALAEIGAKLQKIVDIFAEMVKNNTELTEEQKKEVIVTFFDSLLDSLKTETEKSGKEISDKTEHNKD